MRLLSVLLLAAGSGIALLGPLVWVGRLPVLLGALCVLAAGVLAAREGRRPWLAFGGVAVAVLLFLAPGLVNGWRNHRGIAWEVPEGEGVELATAGYAITSRVAEVGVDDAPVTLVGRDVDSGSERWRTRLGPVGAVKVKHAGQTLLAEDRRGAVHALDLRTGRQRWVTPPAADGTFPEIADAQTVAMLRCGESLRCTVEARALADGALRWSAPADFDNSFLGAPRLTRDSTVTPPVWPASFVIVHPPDGKRYQVRDLTTGRVVASGDARRTLTASLGDVLLRAGATTLTATDVRSGRVLWRRPTHGAVPVRTADLSSQMMAVVDGGLLLAGDTYTMPDLDPGDPLRILDPRTGKVAEHPVGLSGYVDLFPAGTATPGVPLVRKFGDTNPEDDSVKDQLVVDGRRFARDRLSSFEIAATPTQAGFKSTLPVYGLGKRRAIEVYDRRDGARVARMVAAQAHVYSVGDRLVITVGEDEDQRSYVVSGH